MPSCEPPRAPVGAPPRGSSFTAAALLDESGLGVVAEHASQAPPGGPPEPPPGDHRREFTECAHDCPVGKSRAARNVVRRGEKYIEKTLPTRRALPTLRRGVPTCRLPRRTSDQTAFDRSGAGATSAGVMPSFSIFERSVVRFRPRRTAAPRGPATTPLVSRSTSR